MKITPFLILTAVCLLAVLGRPSMPEFGFSTGPTNDEIEAEEYQEPDNEYHVVYKVNAIEDEATADIAWLKKAANLALEKGSSYFNVLDQNITRRFVHKENRHLPVIEGFIQLESDPMQAEYDAREITSLAVSE